METGAASVAPAPEPQPVPESAPELLEAGPGRGRPRRRTRIVLLGAVAALSVALLGWQFWPRPVAPLTLTELQGVYAGMVRGDGTNDAFLLRPNERREPWTVTPSECGPLFDATTFERFPAGAADGVGTFWMAERVGTALSSYRFPDAAAAGAAYQRVGAALTACDGQRVRIAKPGEPAESRTLDIARTPVTVTRGIDQLAYLYAPDASTRFAVHIVRYENTLSFQFRYDSAAGDYAPLPAQQVTDSLVTQMRSIVELRD